MHNSNSRSGVLAFVVAVMSILIGATALHARAVQDRDATVTDLAWLTGCWVEDLGPVKVIDAWAAPVGHTMLGVSRVRQGDSTVGLELRTITDTGRALTLTTLSAAGRTTWLARRDANSLIEFVDTTTGHRSVLRFNRDSSGQLELERKRSIGSRQRLINELFDRAACTD